MQTREVFYTRLKTGELRHHDRPPKRLHVRESVTVVSQNDQHTSHQMALITADNRKLADATLEAWCGFDRGPKHNRIIHALFDRELTD